MSILCAPRLLRSLTLGLLALSTAVLPGCIIGAFHVERETRAVQVAHTSASPVAVRTENGDVSIIADSSASGVGITADIRAQTLQRLADTRIVATRDADGTLRVCVLWADDKMLDNEGCDFAITLPDASGVNVDTSNGEVTVQGLAGSAVLRSSNGRISAIRQRGPVDAGTSNGRISITDPGGDVRAKTSNGSVEIVNAPGRVEADSSNGRLVIELADASPGPVIADTSNGSVRLVVGASFRGRLSLDTSNGDVSLENVDSREGIFVNSLKDSAAELSFGPSGDRSKVDTSNGSITVQVRLR